MQDNAVGYSAPARWLHWLVAVLLFATLPLGLVIKFVAEEHKLTFYMLHESIGLVILWLMLARLAVRLIRPPAPRPPMPRWEASLAHLVHGLLYAVLIVQPIVGFLATNAFGFPLDWFWIVPVPSPLGENQELAPRLMAIHVALGYAILVLFALHIAGVLWHRLYRRDRILHRMT